MQQEIAGCTKIDIDLVNNVWVVNTFVADNTYKEKLIEAITISRNFSMAVK